MRLTFEPGTAASITPPPREAVFVWRVPLDPPEAAVTAGRRLLAHEEHVRADRFRFDRHRRRFVVGRAALRVLLGALTGTRPEALAFATGEKGKPALPGGPQFNLSNSHELALIAVTPEEPLGVDLEHLRPLPDAERIAEGYFSASERDTLRTVPAGRPKETAFFRCWTRKEAYIKAIGDGLSMPLDRFDVTLDEAEPCRFLSMDGDERPARDWSLFHLEPGDGYVGALALRGRHWQLRGFDTDLETLLALR